MTASSKKFVVCLKNEGYEVSLERLKIYQVLPDDEAADVQDLAAGARMRAHHWMLDRRRRRALLIRHRRLAGAATRGVEIVHRMQMLQFPFGRSIQGVIRRAHVRVERISAGARHFE